ncbi:MAG: DUF4147 domain-containing protein, partial [Anaerolineales bacterium]
MKMIVVPPEPKTLFSHPYKEPIYQALTHAIKAVSGDDVVQHSLKLDGNTLIVREKPYSLKPEGRLFLLAVGKAAVSMTQGALKPLGDRIERALVITKKKCDFFHPKVEIVYGNHPIPARESIHAAKRLKHFLKNLSADDTLLCLISGGASALLTLPHHPLTLKQLQQTTRLLLHSGATIEEINCI